MRSKVTVAVGTQGSVTRGEETHARAHTHTQSFQCANMSVEPHTTKCRHHDIKS